jgi:murein peptide amidase A
VVRRLGALIAVASVAALVGRLADSDSAPRLRTPLARSHQRSRPPTPTGRRVITIGYSVDHRPIRAVLVGDPHAARAVLVVGCIHGNEQAGIAVAKRLAAGPSVRGAALWIVPVLNPDGVVADTRQNGDQVDLNRNFPYRWRPLGSRGYPQYSGPRALSEPEARAARRLILGVRPRISIWFHQPLGLVDLSGGDPAIERRFARLTGLPARRLIRYPGSAVGWENWRLPGTTAFVVELPPGPVTTPATSRYAAAVLHVAGA